MAQSYKLLWKHPNKKLKTFWIYIGSKLKAERIGRAERIEKAGSASRTGDCGTGETSGSASRTGDCETSGTGETSETGETGGTGGTSGTSETGGSSMFFCVGDGY